MSRVLSIMIALLAIAAIATPVMAEDRLGLAGQLRVRGWHVDDGGSYTETFADQRLRIGGKLSIAEGVSVTFRTDITESDWGSGNVNGSGRTTVGGSDFQSQHWDRAHLDLSKNNMHLRAGQQFIKLGNSGVDQQSNGLAFNLKGAIPVSVFSLLVDDNGSDNDSDEFISGIRVGHSTDLYAANAFVGNWNDGMEADVYVIGVTSSFNLDAVKLYGEVEYFTGDFNDAMNIDAVGLQLFLDGSLAASEAATVGAQFFYAQGTDDADETQVHLLGSGFDGWDPLLDVGTGLSNERIALGNPYELLGSDAGVIGGRLYGMLKASDALNLGASVAYLEPEEDSSAVYDSKLVLAGGVKYAVMPNTSLDLQLQYVDPDPVVGSADEEFSTGVGLFVNF